MTTPMPRPTPARLGMTRRRMLQLGGMGAFSVVAGSSFLAACGDDDDGATTATVAGTAGGTAAGTSGGAALERLRLGFAYIGPTNDNGWTFEHDRGRLAVEAALGDRVETTYVENVLFDPAQTTPILQDLASGNDLVIANTEYSTLLSDVAERNPETKFLECNGHIYTDNLYSYYIAHQQPAYAMGVAAALLNEGSPVRIGYIGAFPTATAYNDVNGMLLGARSVNPDATVQAVMISSFFDPPKATAAAEALLNEDINFIFAVMDEPSYLQVANSAGVWAGSWNTDTRQFGPEVYVNTLQLDFGPYYVEQATNVLEGRWQPQEQPDLLPLDLGEWGEAVPEAVRTAVDEVRERLRTGALNPYTGPIVDSTGQERVAAGESLDDQQAYLIDWSVEGVSGVDA